jgi:hypothetical protein
MKLIKNYIDEVEKYNDGADKIKILEKLEYINILLSGIEEAPYSAPKLDLKLTTEEYLSQREMRGKLLLNDISNFNLTEEKKIRLFIDNLLLNNAIKELKKISKYQIIQRLLKELENKFIYDKYDFKKPSKASYLNDGISRELTTLEEKKNYTLKLYKSYFLEYNYFEEEGSLKLTNYSKAIYNAIITFYINGNDYFKATDVYKYLNGNRDNDKINPNEIKEIENEIFKLQCKFIQINIAKCRQDLTDILGLKKPILRVDTLRFKDPRSNKEDYLFKIIEKPFLIQLQQNLDLKQIITAPIEMLKNDRKSKDTIIIKNYLIPIIESIKNKKLNDKILYKTILENAELDNDTKGKNKAKINKILDSFIKNQFIKSYKKTKDYIKISTC